MRTYIAGPRDPSKVAKTALLQKFPRSHSKLMFRSFFKTLCNDVDGKIAQSERMGSEYYTLTCQPPAGDENGKFRRIRVTLRDPNLRVLTKDGYYAPDKTAAADPWQRKMIVLTEAAQSNIPFRALAVSVSGIVRHPDIPTADFIVQLKTTGIHWQLLMMEGARRT